MRPETLLIDDEEDFASLLADRLEMRGFEVRTAYTAAAGLEAAQAREPAVVVLDVNLPDRSGLDVLEEMKGRWPLMQVVMLTGQADVSTAVAGMKLGAFDYLTKPVDADALAQTLDRAAARRLNQEESLRMMETGKLAVMGKLAEGVAHEINNPVNTILQKAGWAEELLEDLPEPGNPAAAEIRAELVSIQEQVRRCKAIVSKLMSFGGRIDPRPTLFELEELIEDALGRFQNRIESLGVVVCLDAPADLPRLLLPRAELDQVLHHLMDNALDAAANTEGPKRIEIAATLEGPGLTITVADNGPGIPEAILPRIFEPFFSTKQVGQGSGLGLSICHGIVRSLGGELRAESGPLGGALVKLTLPGDKLAAQG